MARKNPVNVTFQTVLAVIPITLTLLIACYRVEKLTFAIFILALVGVEGGIIDEYFDGGGLITESSLYDDGSLKLQLIWLPWILGHAILYVYLVRRWSKQWNAKTSGNKPKSAV